jgi:hypothetical protein
MNNIAFVIDEEIVSVVNCDDQHAAVLLSEPIMVDITDMPNVHIGWKYINGQLIAPEMPRPVNS